MDIHSAALLLDGNEYRREVSCELAAALKAAGLVVVYGGSDDLMEFDGAISDEVGAGEGTVAYLDQQGLMQSDCPEGGSDCPYFKRLLKGAATITAHWDRDGFSWSYETLIPHATFRILDDGEPYCRGLVFSLADAVPRAAVSNS